MQARERQIRKQVRAPQWTFLAVCTPGFEPIMVKELAQMGIISAVEASGAVSFTCRLLQAWTVLRHTSIANRVYLRLAHFRSGAREELFRKTAELPWELWINTSCEISVRSVVEYSRISHEGQVAVTVKEAIQRRLASAQWPDLDEAPAPIDQGEQRILVRVIHNLVSISLDASGQNHYQRGFRQMGALAPIRESLAAGLIRWACEGLEPAFLHIHDGMCGSGTLAIEAMALLGGFAPGAGRRFMGEAWPGYSAETLNNGRNRDREEAQKHQGALHRVSAGDIDQSACQLSTQAMKVALAAWGLQETWQCQCQDILTTRPPSLEPGIKGCLVLNPPYDIRLEAHTDSFYRNLASHCARHWLGWRIMVIVPNAQLEVYYPRYARRLDFRHGGLRVAALAWDQGSVF